MTIAQASFEGRSHVLDRGISQRTHQRSNRLPNPVCPAEHQRIQVHYGSVERRCSDDGDWDNILGPGADRIGTATRLNVEEPRNLASGRLFVTTSIVDTRVCRAFVLVVALFIVKALDADIARFTAVIRIHTRRPTE